MWIPVRKVMPRQEDASPKVNEVWIPGWIINFFSKNLCQSIIVWYSCFGKQWPHCLGLDSDAITLHYIFGAGHYNCLQRKHPSMVLKKLIWALNGAGHFPDTARHRLPSQARVSRFDAQWRHTHDLWFGNQRVKLQLNLSTYDGEIFCY